jgi:hypothetical protein
MRGGVAMQPEACDSTCILVLILLAYYTPILRQRLYSVPEGIKGSG